MQPQIVTIDVGQHNRDLEESARRLERSKSYRDLSTVIICPTRGMVHAKVVQSWMGLIKPMNQKVIGPLFAIGLEVGEAYNQTIQMILNNPELSTWKYVLTIEEDNIPAPNSLLTLYEDMDDYDVVGGLYWTKGVEGQPMIYGNPQEMPKNFIPQKPIPETIQPCNGLGMGFTLFKLEIFKKMPHPWFKTLQEFQYGQGAKAMTQDLYFFNNSSSYGVKVACDTRVKIGHYSIEEDIVW